MISSRWRLLSQLQESLSFCAPDRPISRLQFLQLFQAFLLQVKNTYGMVYIVQSDTSGLIATFFARILKETLGISARGLLPSQRDMTLPLGMLLKKTDLIVTFNIQEDSSELLNILSLAKGKDIPLVTFSKTIPSSPFFCTGDLNTYFNCQDEALVKTALFSLLKETVLTWSFDPLPASFESSSFSLGSTAPSFQTGLRL